MDIPYADEVKYFAFSMTKFPQEQMQRMKDEVYDKNRSFVVITDPH